jgi:hypothetical protein
MKRERKKKPSRKRDNTKEKGRGKRRDDSDNAM